jgi:hypothetical protein
MGDITMTNKQLIADAKQAGFKVRHGDGFTDIEQIGEVCNAELTAFADIIRKRDKTEIARLREALQKAKNKNQLTRRDLVNEDDEALIQGE